MTGFATPSFNPAKCVAPMLCAAEGFGGGDAADSISVIGAAGSMHTVPLTGLAADGSSVTVSATGLGADGTQYTVN